MTPPARLRTPDDTNPEKRDHMSHYLVLVRCLFDDVPISLHHDAKGALIRARRAAQELSEDPLAVAPYHGALHTEGSDIISVSVVEFKDCELHQHIGFFTVSDTARLLGKPCRCKEAVRGEGAGGNHVIASHSE
jgi:hypothetical protein